MGLFKDNGVHLETDYGQFECLVALTEMFVELDRVTFDSHRGQ